MSTELQRYSLNGETMGTRYTALFYAGAGMDTDELGQQLARAVARVDQQMSTWKPESDLNRLNAAPSRNGYRCPRNWSRCCLLHCASAGNPVAPSTSLSVTW